MSAPPDLDLDEETSGPADPREHAYIPPAAYGTANHTGHDMTGVQAGYVFGGLTYNNNPVPPLQLPELVVRRAAADELSQVRREFVRPGRFDQAYQVLSDHRVVVLCGKGTGRTFAGRRLLDDQGVTEVVDLNPDRRLGSINESELLRGEGYLWDASDQGEHPFTVREFHRAATLVRAVGCRLVVVLDNRRQAPTEVSSHTVVLTPPDPLNVAVAVLDHRCPDAGEQAKQVLTCDLDSALAEGDPPQKAERAAHLAVEVAEGKREVADALGALTEDVEHAVAVSFDGWSATEYSMLLAVALLEDHPFDEVAAHATRLDDMIRIAELPKDKTLRPRRIFATPRNKLLDDIRAITVEREHPRHPGLREETVRFTRQDWANAVLRHAWREYHVLHTVLRDWMCRPALLERFGGASERALCTLITGVPAHDPLRLVDHLASRHAVVQRESAARVLKRLADAHDLRPLVEQTLESWVAVGSVHRKWTAALVYGSEFGQRDPNHALVQLSRLGHTPNERVQNAVVRGVLDLLSQPETQGHVLNAVPSWLRESSFDRSDGLRTVALGVAMWVVGFSRDPDSVLVDPVLLAEQYPEQVRILVEAILDDPRFGPLALNHLSQLTWVADLQRYRQGYWSVTDESAELLRLATLLAPDLRWLPRRRVVAALGEQHPARRTEIRRILRIARKIQRAKHSW
ncbi:MAG: hypothetical protein ACRDTE_29720 [Pseudonocardiaceae bacterium]